MPAPISLGSSYKDTSLDLFALSPTASSASGACTPVQDEDYFYPRELETTFCRDFSCCGLVLEDLHDLLQHYEECHVRLESDVGGVDLGLFDDDWTSSSDSDPSTQTSPYMKATQTTTYSQQQSGLALDDSLRFTSQDEMTLAAFDAAMLKAANSWSAPSAAPESVRAPTTPSKKRSAPSDSDAGERRKAKKLASGSRSSRKSTSRVTDGAAAEPREKPYRCPVEGCCKSYKNPNGLKYHSLHGHCRSGGDVTPKPYVCKHSNCGKNYKNLNGLKYHIQHSHSTTPEAMADLIEVSE